MLYYKKKIQRRVRIHPQYSGGKHDPIKVARKVLKQEIRNDGFSIEHGYIVERLKVHSICDGFILPHNGMIEFIATFDAIVEYPHPGEVIMAVVERVTDTCILFRYMCMFGLVRSYSLYDVHDYEYKQLEMKTDEGEKNERHGLFQSKVHPDKVIQKGTSIRLRITKRTLGGNGFFLIGSMSNEHLGPYMGPQDIPMLEGPKVDVKPLVKLEIPDETIPKNELDQLWAHAITYSRNMDEEDNESNLSLD